MKTLLIPPSATALTMKEAIEAVEMAFKAKGEGKAQMPSKQYLFFSKHNGDLRTMPAYLEESDVAGVKIVTVHPSNPKEHNLPTVMATIFLTDPRTGFLKAIMDGTYLTALRTGAAGGIAAKYLSREDSETVGIIGAGIQARTQLMALKEVRSISSVKVYDLSKDASEKYAKEMSELLNAKVEVVQSAKEAADSSDIIVTATPAIRPVIICDWILPGVHINAIGADAPGKEELDPEILRKAKIVVDDWDQAIHGGEVNVPISKGIIKKEDIYADIGEIVTGRKRGRESESEITVFDSTGLAIQDVAVASLVFEKAKEKGLGQEIKLF